MKFRPETVHGLPGQRLEDEEVETALEQRDRVVRRRGSRRVSRGGESDS